MKRRFAALFMILVLIIITGGTSSMAVEDNTLYDNFETVAAESKTRPLWFWNDTLAGMTKQDIRDIMVNSGEKSGYFGFAILPDWIDNYLSEDYMELYGYALETAKELGQTMILYDENGWPSGQAGGLLEKQHPEATYKRLDKTEITVSGEQKVSLDLPVGEYRTYIGAVAMNTDTNEITDISDHAIFADGNQAGISASSNHPAIGSETYTADKAFDGNYSTRWNAGRTAYTDQWLEANFGEPVTVDRVSVYEALDRITSYTVEYFDGAEWQTAATGGTLGGKKDISFPAVTASRFRFVANSTAGGNTSASVYELEFFNGEEKLAVPQNEIRDHIEYSVPGGNWRIMAFATVKDGYACVDYLDEDSVQKYIDVTFETYYRYFPEYFGNVIDTAFYDEPGLYHAEGRTWTGDFNKLFQEKYGYNPITLYPAMWYDIGENTESARNALFGFRTDLYAGYIKQVDAWCSAHGLALTGHQDQEEPLNPTGLTGDLMKVFKNQSIPGVDDIASPERGIKMYKIVSSAANNYDKPMVMSESFGAMGEGIGINNMYRDIMGQFTRGINYIIPHAIWYNNKSNVTYPPEMSYRNPNYAAQLPALNNYIGRLQTMLRGGRHVCDIAVLYPIDSLQSDFAFDTGDPYLGGTSPEYADYQDVGELLLTGVKRDYTFIHPDVLSEKCSVNGSILHMDNQTNYENYDVVIMPGQSTISLAALQKIKEFYDNGGKVVATTRLPGKSAEAGKDSEIVKIISEMFGVSEEKFYPRSSVSYSASSVYSSGYEAKFAFDGNSSESSRWNAADQSGGNQWIEVDFGKSTPVNRVVIDENDPYRVTAYRVQYWTGSEWADAASGGGIGRTTEHNFNRVVTDKMRLYIDSISDQSASIREFAVYYNDSDNLALPKCERVESGNQNGGKAIFLGASYASELRQALDDCTKNPDVKIENMSAKNLTYIHKVKDGQDIYFFANAGGAAVDTSVSLLGQFSGLYAWNPYDGTRTAVESTYNGVTTELKLSLGEIDSVFIVGEKKQDITGDINGDEKVTVSDVVELRKIIMTGKATPQQLLSGDLDEDGKLSVSDVVELRKRIMKG